MLNDNRKASDYLFLPFDELPQTLQGTFQNIEVKYWASQDGFIEVVEAWMKGGKKILNQEEIFRLAKS